MIAFPTTFMSGVAGPTLAWDSASKGSGITLSNGDLDIESNTNWNTARSNVGKSTGKWYFEIKAIAVVDHLGIYGICDDTTSPMTNYIGNFSNTAGSLTGGANYLSGFTGASTPSLGSFLSVNDVVGVSFDADAKKAWLALNNLWLASGDPAAGTTPWVTWSGSYTIYAANSLYTAGNKSRLMTSNYSPPSGFSVLA